jgi:MoxR-like ATPase
MLTDVPEIDQKTYKAITKFTIRNGGNVLVLGPSGSGKTEIAKQATQEEGCDLIYINLAVLERTDFQGFPVISENKKYVNYATPEFLPFQDIKNLSITESINEVISNINDQSDLYKKLSTISNSINKKTKEYSLRESANKIKPIINNDILNNKDFQEILNNNENKEKPIVILFDEVDKALPETNQVLLEILQYGSINGRKLNIKSCILTGNLPDEHAHVNQISHAISKRCKTFKLSINFNVWQSWAIKNNIHTNVIQFLSSDPNYLNRSASDGDTTAYAMPSPRTWGYVSDIIKSLEVEKYDFTNEDNDLFILKMISGCVGSNAAVKYTNWFKFYKKYDSTINNLINNGINPDTSNLSEEKCLVLAVSACSKLYNSLNPNTSSEQITKIVNNVFSWLKTLNQNIQIGAIRLSFGGDYSICETYNLTEMEVFKEVFISVKNKLQEFNCQ